SAGRRTGEGPGLQGGPPPPHPAPPGSLLAPVGLRSALGHDPGSRRAARIPRRRRFTDADRRERSLRPRLVRTPARVLAQHGADAGGGGDDARRRDGPLPPPQGRLPPRQRGLAAVLAVVALRALWGIRAGL